ncbi:MAG: hypothetical protein RIR83_723, partial [Pseudomonadota bacterium]
SLDSWVGSLFLMMTGLGLFEVMRRHYVHEWSQIQTEIEIEIKHEERFAGESKYTLYQLIRLNFDLVTGFSVLPLQAFSLIGILLALASGALFMYLLIRRFVIGAEVEGVFTLFALNFFLMGVMLFGLGLLGEYIGRIYQQVRQRPRYVVMGVLERDVAQ